MQNDSRAVFPNGIGALIVDNDERFLRSATLMLSLLNFRVATCERPTSVVKLITGRLKDADVVFIDALRAATCGFDFRRIVESHLCIPVVYFLSRDYGVDGDVAEALQRTVWAATYVVKKPLDAGDLSRLWRVIKWSKFLLRRAWPEWPARGSRVHPAVVGALLPSSSTVEGRWEEDDDDGREHFRVARAGRGRRRKLGDRRHDGGRSSGRGCGGVAGPLEIGIRGQPPTERLEQMNLTGWQESYDDDVFPSHQQRAQPNRRGIQAMDVQNQQHGRPLFVQPVPQMLNVPRNNPMISADAAWPSSSDVAAFAGASNTTAPTLLQRVYQAPARARATSPAPHAVYSAQAPAAPGLRPPVYQKQQPVAPLYDFGDMVAPPPPAAVPTMGATSGHQPQFTLNHQQQEMFAPRRQGGWMGCRRETGPVMLSFQQPPAADPFTPMAGGGTAFGASSPTGATDAGAYGAAAVAHLQSPNAGAQTAADSFDDVLRAMMEMDYYANCSAEALMAPATDELAGMQAAAPGSGNFSNYNAGSFMVTDVNGGNGTPFMPPQDPAVPTGNQQVELGAPDIYGSLAGSHQGGPSAMFNGGGDMAPMFPSDEYGENAMFSLDALLDFDDAVPMYPEGQQVAAADSTTASNATGIMSNGGDSGGLGPSWNMRAAAADDEGLDMLEEFLMDDKESDFLLLQDINNGHQ